MEVTFITTLEDQKEIDVLNDAIRSNRVETVLTAQKMLNEYSYFYVLVDDSLIGSIYDIVRLVSEQRSVIVNKTTALSAPILKYSNKYEIDNRMKPRLTIKEI